jgi:hypothetical protein
MTLANMRANGVSSLLVYCNACPRTVVFNIGAYPEAVSVPAFGPRMVCTGYGWAPTLARISKRSERSERYGDKGQSLAPPLSGALRALPYPHGGLPEYRLKDIAKLGAVVLRETAYTVLANNLQWILRLPIPRITAPLGVGTHGRRLLVHRPKDANQKIASPFNF